MEGDAISNWRCRRRRVHELNQLLQVVNLKTQLLYLLLDNFDLDLRCV